MVDDRKPDWETDGAWLALAGLEIVAQGIVPTEGFPERRLDEPFSRPDTDFGGGRRERPVGGQDAVSEEHVELRDVCRAEVFLNRVDRRQIPSGAVDIQHGAAELLFNVGLYC